MLNKKPFTLFLISIFVGFLVIDIERNHAQSQSSPLPQEFAYMPEALNLDGQRYVPVDILKSDVTWDLSEDGSQIDAKAKLVFQVQQAGRPLFLLNPNAQGLLNQKTVELMKLQDSDLVESRYYGLNQEVKPGVRHALELNYSFTYDRNQAKHILPLEYYFQKFVEMGIPANGSYDAFPLELTLNLKNGQDYEVFANGKIQKLSANQYRIQFPEYFTSLSFFIDVAFKKTLVREIRQVQSVDGRKLDVVVYGEDASTNKWVPTFAGIIEYTFYEMEKMFGVYPQETIIMKLSDKPVGGGAYAGAMVLSSDYMEHISHELGHSWYLQSVRPARGEDSWIYEGFGNWAPMFGYRSGFAKDLNLEDSIILGTGDYKLWATPAMFPIKGIRNPHQTGSMVLASIDQFIKTSGREDLKEGLVPILKAIAVEKRHQTMSTQDFKELLEKHTGLDFSPLFEFYTRHQ